MKFNGRNLTISPTAQIGRNVRIGDNTTIYDNVRIGDNSIIANDCVIGEPLHDYYFTTDYQNPPTVIGEHSMVRSHTIIYAGCDIGANFMCGHRVTIREYARFGKHNMIGTLGDIQGYCTLGDYCRMQCNVHIGQQTNLGNFVFVFPFTVFTNDPHPPSELLVGATVGDYTQIAVHCTILPGTDIGRNCLVGANSVVNGNFSDERFIVGSPAREAGNIRRIKSREAGREGDSHYPWMYHFDRNMPWAGIGYDTWFAAQTDYQ